MRLRVLLALQLLGALLTLAFFLAVTSRILWIEFGGALPTTITYQSAEVPTQFIFILYAVTLLVLTALVFLLLYLFINRLIIHPIKAITGAMAAFAESQTYQPLSKVSLTIFEVRALAKVFAEFADSVEQLHKRDMEISRVKSDFISTAAHQFRTPLTGIRWALEALDKEDLTESQKSLVENAAAKSRDLVAIVGMLLDITSIESGKHKYNFTSVDVERLTSEVIADFTVQAAEHKVIIEFVQPPKPLPLVRADRDQIKWVLNNLIENGIRYTPAGGAVRILFAQVPDRVQIMVRDTGIGITPKDRNNIFERFYRADNAIAKENTGNGLGLYIARTIATDHGGDLNFSPNPSGPGTTFSLSLPLAR